MWIQFEWNQQLVSLYSVDVEVKQISFDNSPKNCSRWIIFSQGEQSWEILGIPHRWNFFYESHRYDIKYEKKSHSRIFHSYQQLDADDDDDITRLIERETKLSRSWNLLLLIGLKTFISLLDLMSLSKFPPLPSLPARFIFRRICVAFWQKWQKTGKKSWRFRFSLAARSKVRREERRSLKWKKKVFISNHAKNRQFSISQISREVYWECERKKGWNFLSI